MSSDDKDKKPSSAAESPFGDREVKQPGYSLFLLMPDNYLECRCSYVPYKQGAMLTCEELLDALNMNGVLEGIDDQACDDFVIDAAAGRQQIKVLLASGTPPVNGTDEYFQYLVSSSTAVYSGFDDKTKADMYSIQTFINVASGDEIGRIIPGEEGTAGRSISGVEIPPAPGKQLKWTIGKNIRVEEGGLLLVAAAAGRIYQTSSGISVEEEFVVKGDVNFKVGVIHFNGFVEVHGDVLDKFDITATKGLTVRGNIGVCTIVSEGDITLCGMDGQGMGSIVCGGTLRAHHIHDTIIECAGDVLVEVEIHNCTIRTLGRIVVNKDTISGGSCIAQGGIESNKLGSPSARHTSLLVGVDYHYVEELKRLLEELAITQAEIRQGHSLGEVTGLRKIAAGLSDRIANIRSKTVAAANAKINVKSTLHENVFMTLGDVVEALREPKAGPITIVENISEGGLRFIPMSSMDVKATDIERAFVRDQEKASE